jgi:hypothetical protein
MTQPDFVEGLYFLLQTGYIPTGGWTTVEEAQAYKANRSLSWGNATIHRYVNGEYVPVPEAAE